MALTDRAPLSEYPVRRKNGTIGDGASVRILAAGTSTPITVYSTRTGGGTLSQPLTADSNGILAGHVPIHDDGYDAEVTIDGVLHPVQRIRPGTSGPNASASRALLNAASIQTKRVTTGSIAAGTSASVTVTWDTAFADANYTPGVVVLESTAATTGLHVARVTAQTAASITVRVRNDAAGALTGTLNAIAIHD